MKPRPGRTQPMLTGVSAWCLAMLLSGCATLPSLLPTSRIVVACPPELQYQPRRSFPPLADPLTNDGLAEFALSLIVQVRREWAAADQAASDCNEYLRTQGLK